MKKRNDVAIIIVTYNSEDEISACLESVLQERKSITQQVIVIDNESSDGTVEIVKQKFPEVELVQPGKNLGFAAGVNLGVGLSDAEFVLLFNPDAVVRDHAVDKVVEFARANPKYGLYGGRALDEEGKMDPSSCWGAPSLWSLLMFATGLSTFAPRNSLLDPESLGGWQRDTVREVGIITGCFLLAARDVWDELKGFDERYFMYGEDADLAIRARKAGYAPVVFPGAEFIHEGGKSSDTPVSKTLLLFKGKASLVRIQWTGFKRQLGLLLLALGTGLRAMLANFSTLTGARKAADRWPTVWSKRDEWLPGYGEPRHSEIRAEAETAA